MRADGEVETVPPRARRFPVILQLAIVGVLAAGTVMGALFFYGRSPSQAAPPPREVARPGKGFVPTPEQLSTFTIKTVEENGFQAEHLTEGKIGVDEDRTTAIFSPYAGRVIRLMARQGEVVSKGQVLFTVEATDMVQAQNDLVAAVGGVNKARSQLQLQQTIEKRQRELYESKAIALKEWQSAQNELVGAQNDLRGAEGALEAVRNRLSILGRTEGEVAGFIDKGGRMSPETPIVSPIAGTVISRKIGPGQYVSASSGDAPYTIGDLSSVWLIANVREVEVPAMQIGQPLTFKVLAFPDRTFSARVSFVGASVDPGTRRVVVRAQVDNLDGALKPEMFASIRITQGVAQMSPAVPKEAVIYEGDTARVWALMPDGSVELRRVTTGLVSGQMLQITSGLNVGDRIITKGSLFIDRLASGEGS